MGSSCCRANTINNHKSTIHHLNKREYSNLKFSKISDLKNKYEFISMIGNGGFGKVRLYREIGNKTLLYAIKTLKKDHLTDSSINMIQEEISILSNLDHPNIVKYFETYEDSAYINIVMEYVGGYDLFKVISLRKYNKFTEKDFAEIIYNLLLAVNFLHKKKLVHRDIKPENILFSQSGIYSSLKLIDFGLATSISNNVTGKKCGTPHYIAPEMLSKGKFTEKTDAWSIGVVMYVMVTGKFPFDGSKIYEKIMKGEYDKILLKSHKKRSNELIDLIEKFMVLNMDERLSVKDALEHSWFKTFKKADNIEIDNNVIEALCEFNTKNSFQKEVMFYLAKLSKDDEINRLKMAFAKLDEDKCGILHFWEIRNGFKSIGLEIDEVSF